MRALRHAAQHLFQVPKPGECGAVEGVGGRGLGEGTQLSNFSLSRLFNTFKLEEYYSYHQWSLLQVTCITVNIRKKCFPSSE